jgi:hypothetical protein
MDFRNKFYDTGPGALTIKLYGTAIYGKQTNSIES